MPRPNEDIETIAEYKRECPKHTAADWIREALRIAGQHCGDDDIAMCNFLYCAMDALTLLKTPFCPPTSYQFGGKTFTVGEQVRLTAEGKATFRCARETGIVTAFLTGSKGRQRPPYKYLQILMDGRKTPQTHHPDFWEPSVTPH